MGDLTEAPRPHPFPKRGRGGALQLPGAKSVALRLALTSDASGGDISTSMKAEAGSCG